MTTEQLLEQIKALPEIEFANLMRDLRDHVSKNKMEHALIEAGAKYEDPYLEEEVEELEEEVRSLRHIVFMAETQAESAKKEIEELKEKLAEYESEQL